MKWHNDNKTIVFLNEHLPERFANYKHSAAQFSGKNFNAKAWLDKVAKHNRLYDFNLSSPENIIYCFQNNFLLDGLALVVSWGTMQRQNNNIYKVGLTQIEDILRQSKNSIAESNQIDKAWNLLSQDLNWSPVIISKTLHFISRALGHPIDAPVALDNLIILQKVWPFLIKPVAREDRPESWKGGKDGYLRYMTFINYLRQHHYKNWTNTEIECTLFRDFYR